MEKRSKSSEKENINASVSLTLSKVKNKLLPGNKVKNASLLGSSEVE
jgi:hypothetical protein